MVAILTQRPEPGVTPMFMWRLIGWVTDRSVKSSMAALALLLVAVIVHAAELETEPDHELARRALEAGEIVSLATILDAVEKSVTGEVVEVELERDQGRWVYEVEILTRQGKIVELLYDAKTSTPLAGQDAKLEKARRTK
jgi:uncharacterized membrane protein YkoI